MTRERIENPPDLDAEDEAALDRIWDEVGIADGTREKIDTRGKFEIPQGRTPPPPRMPPPPRRS